MTRNRTNRGVVSLLVLLVVGTTMTAAYPVSAAQTNVQVQSVDVSVDQPAPGEPFTLSVNIANLASSSGPVDVTDLYVRKGGDGFREFARIEDTGTIAAGGNLTVPLTMSLDELGSKRLSVHVVVEDSDGDYRRINYPLYVEVEDSDEAVISFSSIDPTAGQESAFNVTVSNVDTSPLSNVQLQLGENVDIENPERVSASLSARTQASYRFQATFPEAGSQSLNATLTYQSSSGSTRTEHRSVEVDVEQATSDVELDVSNQIQNDSSAIRAELYQFGSAKLEDIQIRVQNNGDTVARVPVADISGESSRTVLLDDDEIPAGNVSITAAYTAGSDQQAITESLLYSKYSPAPTSAITLTDIGITRDGGTLTIEGEAANVGTAQVNSVLISAANTDDVTAVGPTKEYFIDNIGSNELETFETTVNTSSNLDQIPIQVEYTINGQRVSSMIPVDISTIESQSDSNQEGGSPLLAVILLLIVVAGAGFGVYRWRN